MAIIQCMADENEKKRISFEFYKESDEKLIQAAFFEGGKKGKIKYHLPVQHHPAPLMKHFVR